MTKNEGKVLNHWLTNLTVEVENGKGAERRKKGNPAVEIIERGQMSGETGEGKRRQLPRSNRENLEE